MKCKKVLVSGVDAEFALQLLCPTLSLPCLAQMAGPFGSYPNLSGAQVSQRHETGRVGRQGARQGSEPHFVKVQDSVHLVPIYLSAHSSSAGPLSICTAAELDLSDAESG